MTTGMRQLYTATFITAATVIPAKAGIQSRTGFRVKPGMTKRAGRMSSCINERGVAAAEFALLLPVLLLIVFGTIEFGMIMYSREVVANASREGARAGIVLVSPKLTSGQITTITTNYLTGTGINPSNVTIAVTGAGGANPATLTVTATYRYPWLIPYIPSLLSFPSPLPLTGQVVMRHE